MLVASARNEKESLFIKMLFVHGCRLQDLIKLKWRHVDLKNRKIKFLNPTRTHDLDTEEADALRKLTKTKLPKAHVFTPHGKGKQISFSSTWSWFSAASMRAGLESIRPHPFMMRHSKCFALASSGHSTSFIKEYCGFRTDESVVKYIELIQKRDTQDQRKILE